MEQRLAHAGLQIALTPDAPLKLIVMDDPPFDNVSIEKVIVRMKERINAGDLDQFIICDWSDRYTALKKKLKLSDADMAIIEVK